MSFTYRPVLTLSVCVSPKLCQSPCSIEVLSVNNCDVLLASDIRLGANIILKFVATVFQ